MLDIRRLRQSQEDIRLALKRRNFELNTNLLQDLLKQRSSLQEQTEALQQRRNTESRAIGQAQAKGEDVSTLKVEMSELGEQLDILKVKLDKAQDAFHKFMLTIPNVPDQSVPEGESDAENVEIRKIGTPRQFDFEPEDHVTLGENNNLLDFAAASGIAGTRFVVMRGPIARLHNALAQFMLNVHIEEHGYEQVYVPFIANADALTGTGQLPKFAEDQFRLDGKSDRYLIATGEIPVTNIFRDSILEASSLPLKLVSHTPCFRKEAGNYGKDTRGMIRQHQFEKVELVQLVRPDQSWQVLEELTGHAERILKSLELPYRVVTLCGGDLGFAAAKTYDLEAWLPSQQAYREISSCSNFLDFQARRMKARWRNPDTGKVEFVHTLNGSGLAVGRTLVAVMENYQNAKGQIVVPEVLAPWMNGIQVIE